MACDLRVVRVSEKHDADLLLLLLCGSPLQPVLPRIDTQTPRISNFLPAFWLFDVICELIVFMLYPELDWPRIHQVDR